MTVHFGVPNMVLYMGCERCRAPRCVWTSFTDDGDLRVKALGLCCSRDPWHGPDVPEEMPLPFLVWGLLDGPFVAELQGWGCTEREWGQIVAFMLVYWHGWAIQDETVTAWPP